MGLPIDLIWLNSHHVWVYNKYRRRRSYGLLLVSVDNFSLIGFLDSNCSDLRIIARKRIYCRVYVLMVYSGHQLRNYLLCSKHLFLESVLHCNKACY